MSNISEFKQYLREHKPSKVIFTSEDQHGFDVAEPIVLSLSFPSVFVAENPNVIYMTDGVNSMRFNMVKQVKVCNKTSVLGTEVIVSCSENNREKTYMLLLA